MTLRVLVMPEDFRKDQFVLEPIVKAMFAASGRNAVVEILRDPLLGGIDAALDEPILRDVVTMYPMVDLFLLIVDRDLDANRERRLRDLESKLADVLGERRFLLGENAWQEIEVWLLAGHDLPSDWRWADIRSERDPKERYFEPFARARGVWEHPAQGRGTLGRAAARRYDRIRQLSPEVAQFEARIVAVTSQQR